MGEISSDSAENRNDNRSHVGISIQIFLFRYFVIATGSAASFLLHISEVGLFGGSVWSKYRRTMTPC
jgi:hypothetical protein